MKSTYIISVLHLILFLELRIYNTEEGSCWVVVSDRLLGTALCDGDSSISSSLDLSSINSQSSIDLESSFEDEASWSPLLSSSDIPKVIVLMNTRQPSVGSGPESIITPLSSLASTAAIAQLSGERGSALWLRRPRLRSSREKEEAAPRFLQLQFTIAIGICPIVYTSMFCDSAMLSALFGDDRGSHLNQTTSGISASGEHFMVSYSLA